MSYTKEEQAANRAKWVEALRSGEYRQGSGSLQADGKFCCLGVACDVAIKNGVPLETTHRAGDYWLYGGMTNILPSQVINWLGLYDAGGEFVDPLEDGAGCLWQANDVSELPFKTIADLIESGKVRLA